MSDLYQNTGAIAASALDSVTPEMLPQCRVSVGATLLIQVVTTEMCEVIKSFL